MKRITAVAALVLALPFAACGTPRSATVRAVGSQGTAAPAESALFSMPEPTPVAVAAPAAVVEIDTPSAVVVSRQPATPVSAAEPVHDGPQPYSPPVMHRDPQSGFCFGAGANDLPAEDAADPSCPQQEQPTTTTVPEATPEQQAAPLASVYPTTPGYDPPQPHEGSSAQPGQHYPTCWTGCSPSSAAAG